MLFRVTIGGEKLEVEATDNLSARFEAAQIFRSKFKLRVPLIHLIPYAKARQVPDWPEPVRSSEEVVKEIKCVVPSQNTASVQVGRTSNQN